MWQAISRLLSEQLGEGEIELRNELPGGEVHAAWHLRYAGRDFSSNVMKGTCFPVLPPKPINWNYYHAVKPLLCPESGLLALTGTTVFW